MLKKIVFDFGDHFHLTDVTLRVLSPFARLVLLLSCCSCVCLLDDCVYPVAGYGASYKTRGIPIRLSIAPVCLFARTRAARVCVRVWCAACVLCEASQEA